MSAAAATRVELDVPATDVIPGDVIHDPDLIPVLAGQVSKHAIKAGFMVIDYTIPGTTIPGSRTYALTTIVHVLRNEEGAH